MKLAKLNKRRIGPPKSNGVIAPSKLDLGAGPNGKPGFWHVDQTSFPGVDQVLNLAEPIYVPIPKGFEWMAECFERKVSGYISWPWESNSIEEAHSSHCVEHFDRIARVHFWNELYRVMKPGAKATIIAPHWASCRAYGDPTHQWPPISEFGWFYLKREWRASNAPHSASENWMFGLSCNFEVVWGYSLEPGVAQRNQEYQQYAMTYLKEACQDCIATLTKI